jgi:hypothetical protein
LRPSCFSALELLERRDVEVAMRGGVVAELQAGVEPDGVERGEPAGAAARLDDQAEGGDAVAFDGRDELPVQRGEVAAVAAVLDAGDVVEGEGDAARGRVEGNGQEYREQDSRDHPWPAG